MKNFRFAGALVALLMAGCAGYQVNATRPKFMGDVKTVAVPVFKNETYEPRVEVMATSAVVKQLQADGSYSLAPAESADAIVEGVVTDIDRDPARGVRGNVIATREFELIVKVKYIVRHRVTGRVLDSREVDGQTSFFVGGDVQQDERQALPLAFEDAAVRMVSQLSEGW
jgi:hypothetical protein